ncbi:MAG: phosphate ABC transporter permease subunit PstC [Mycobacteriales bacterium]
MTDRNDDDGPPAPVPDVVSGPGMSGPVGGVDTAAIAGAAMPSRNARRGDRIFAGLATGSGIFVIALVALVAAFLLQKAIPAIAHDKVNFLTSRTWEVDSKPLKFGIADLLWVTVISSVLAMIIALPVSVGIALFITQYAPRRLARPVASAIDLLAAIPSIVYGVWGIYVLAPQLSQLRDGFVTALGWFPLFGKTAVDDGTIFIGTIVLTIMILPIMTALNREVFERTPTDHIEGAWALGATRWEMIRMTVLPHGRAGVISGSMLGLGRALGETIAVTLILSTLGNGSKWSWSIFHGGETFASRIANNAAEFNEPSKTGAFIAAGLVLFLLTFAVNAVARIVINRSRRY